MSKNNNATPATTAPAVVLPKTWLANETAQAKSNNLYEFGKQCFDKFLGYRGASDYKECARFLADFDHIEATIAINSETTATGQQPHENTLVENIHRAMGFYVYVETMRKSAELPLFDAEGMKFMNPNDRKEVLVNLFGGDAANIVKDVSDRWSEEKVRALTVPVESIPDTTTAKPVTPVATQPNTDKQGNVICPRCQAKMPAKKYKNYSPLNLTSAADMPADDAKYHGQRVCPNCANALYQLNAAASKSKANAAEREAQMKLLAEQEESLSAIEGLLTNMAGNATFVASAEALRTSIASTKALIEKLA